ncbi:MAG TPA: pitrilysin family protein [Candidatus Eisenbacteria bacterium]|nr:pitrilysin family protein [Candidatus Eisenbacteria bacterium]
MLHSPNLLRAKGLSRTLALLIPLVSMLAPGPSVAQEREMPETAARPRQPVYDPGQPVQRKVLKNGVRLLVQEQRTSDRVAGVIGLKMGTRYETENESGLSQIMMRALSSATERRSGPELQLELLAAGATIESGAGADMGQISISTTRERVSKAIDLLSDITLNPAFPDTAFEAARGYFLGKASDDVSGPLSGTYAIFLRTFYRGSPFERPAFGQVRTIGDSRRSDIVALYKKLFVGGNMSVCFVGNFDGKKVMAELEKAFATAAAGSPPAPLAGEPIPLAADTLVSEERPYRAQSLAYGYPAPGYGDPDYPAFMIIDSYLRSGDRSPITYWLPEKRLATGVGILYPRYPKHSSMTVYLGATPLNWKAARDTVATVMRRLTSVPLDKGDWTAHLKRVQAAYFKDQDSPLVRARDMARYETLDMGLDYPKRFETRLLELKPEDVRDAAARWFTHACEVTFLPSKVDSGP